MTVPSWRVAVSRSRLRPTEKLVAHTIELFVTAAGVPATYTHEDVAHFASLNRVTVTRALGELRQLDWIDERGAPRLPEHVAQGYISGAGGDVAPGYIKNGSDHNPERRGVAQGYKNRSSTRRSTKSSKALGSSVFDFLSRRRDVAELCDLLADEIARNGVKRPTITAKWVDAARLLIDRDERPLTEAKALIRWAQSDPFWCANVLSMTKFRQQYDRLLLQSRRRQQAKRRDRAAEIARGAIANGSGHDEAARRSASGQLVSGRDA